MTTTTDLFASIKTDYFWIAVYDTGIRFPEYERTSSGVTQHYFYEIDLEHCNQLVLRHATRPDITVKIDLTAHMRLVFFRRNTVVLKLGEKTVFHQEQPTHVVGWFRQVKNAKHFTYLYILSDGSQVLTSENTV